MLRRLQVPSSTLKRITDKDATARGRLFDLISITFSAVRSCACRRHACCRRRGAREEPGQRLPAHFATKAAEQEERFESDSYVSDSQCSAVLLLLQQLPIYISTGCPPLIPPSRNNIASQHLSYHFFCSSGRTFPVVDHHLEYLLQRTEYAASSLQLHQVIHRNPTLAGTPSHLAGAMH